ncbi:MAG: hypothetical protein IBX56_19685 [Methylomicrobium sp.]|nr:hypothetical protein [Methylomicrobium sp.]
MSPATVTFADIQEICRRLGLSARQSGRKNHVFEGVDAHGLYRRTAIHWKASGRLIAKGTASQIAKDLGFKDLADMYDFLQNKRRKR